ncbi:MAG: polysaccharide biosynthesis tyrosine autokinase [Pedobacter sp.]|nr:MAG: polysaccharide biosynthesis tyrosine autokinase [Pedobacter sp.]
MEQKDNIIQSKNLSQNIDFYKIFKVFMSRWYWILGCVIIALILAKIKILYTPAQYQAYASIKIQESNPILSTPSQSSQVASYTDKILAEGYVIRSNDVVLDAIKNLDYRISYHLKGRIRTTELYPSIPFQVDILNQDTLNFSRERYQVSYIDQDKFGLRPTGDPDAKYKFYRYGQPITLGNTTFRITTPVPQNGDYSFNFNSKEDFLGRITSGLNTSEAARFTNVMSISMFDQNYNFAADALNAVIQSYIKYDILQKQKSAKQTVDFINTQLAFITDQVDSSSANLTNYKAQNNILDVGTTANQLMVKLTDAENRKNLLEIELLGITQLESQIQSARNKIEINLNLEGSITPSQSALIAEYNRLAANRDFRLQELNASAPAIKEIDAQMNQIREALQKSIDALKTRNLKTAELTNNQITTLESEIRQLPIKEQKFVRLNSNFQVNNRVQEYLKEKKLEAEMNAAATVPGAAVVNKAMPNNYNIGVNERSIYTYALMAGLAAGIGLILLVRFLNPYIYDKETVEALTRTPIIGVIRKFPEFIDKNNRQALSLSKPKSVFAESVRSVRTNLSFLASHKKSKTICITSEISGEGKSFVTINLAGTLALIEKRVILIAADLRKSKLHKAFGSDNRIGLSTYLSGQNTLEEILHHDDVHNIDFLPSGPVPPNPSELLHTEKMKELLEYLTPLYDYVLVDTAPVGLVSDAIPLIRQSDINLFVIRSGKSQYRAAAIPERLSREYGLSNLAIVLNAFGDDALHSNYYTTDYSKGGGNSTYYYSDYSGYAGAGYYDNDPKRWWEFWKKK